MEELLYQVFWVTPDLTTYFITEKHKEEKMTDFKLIKVCLHWRKNLKVSIVTGKVRSSAQYIQFIKAIRNSNFQIKTKERN